jgi:hypothetical protein
MPVMGTCRGDRVHLSEWIDLMSNIQANGFVAPTLDPRNMGTNDAGGDSDNVSNSTVVGAGAAGSVESKGGGDGVTGEPQLEPRAMGPVEGESGVEGDGASQKHISNVILERGSYQSKLMHSPFQLCIMHVWIVGSILHSVGGVQPRCPCLCPNASVGQAAFR